MATAHAEMITIEKPSTPQAIVAEMSPIVEAAVTFAVADVGSHAEALNRIRACRDAEKRIELECQPMKKAVQAAHKETLAFIARFIGPIQAARSIYDVNAAAYEKKEREKAEEESRRLQERARKEEEERALLAAIEAEEHGEPAQAEAMLAEPVSVPVVTVAPAVAKVEGVSSRTTWSAEVTDLLALVRYVAAHPEWVSLLEPAMPNLNRLAVSQRDALAIPGVHAVSRAVRSIR